MDPTFGGLAFGLTYGRPEESIEAVAGALAIKDATLTMTVHYAREVDWVGWPTWPSCDQLSEELGCPDKLP